MNKRIQELAERSGFSYHITTGLVAMPDADPAKFAELIVRECSSVAWWAERYNIGDGEPVSVRILRQFGVKE